MMNLIRRGRQRWQALGKDQSGASAIEFGLIATPFFFMLIGLLELCLMFIVTTVLEHGVDETARKIRTGEFQKSSTNTLADFEAEICTNMAGLFNCAANIDIDVRTYASFADTANPSPIDVDGNYDDTSFQFVPGGRNDIVVVRVFFEWDLITPVISRPLANMTGNKRLLQATVAFRNEPF